MIRGVQVHARLETEDRDHSSGPRTNYIIVDRVHIFGPRVYYNVDRAHSFSPRVYYYVDRAHTVVLVPESTIMWTEPIVQSQGDLYCGQSP